MVFLRSGFWILFCLLALLLLILAWRLRLRWWLAWPLRAALVGLALLGLFSPPAGLDQRPVPQRQVMVVDQSDSLSEEARLQARQQAIAWQAGRENRLVVAFAAEPRALLPSGGPWPALDGRASNLAGALELAGELLGSSPGKVILVSDGRADQPARVAAAAANLARQNHTLDGIHLPPRPEANDLAVSAPAAPQNLWSGTPFDLLLPVHAPAGVEPVLLQLKINAEDAAILAEPAGAGLYRFHIPALPQGIATLQVTAGAGGAEAGAAGADPFLGNNAAYAALQVFAPPRVVFVTSEPAGAAAGRFGQALAENGLQVDVLDPQALPTNLENLQAYRVIFLHNLLSSQLGREQMQALQVFVSRLAGGLIFLGGRNSYTLGAYQTTLLEPLLPVKLEPPPRSERPPVVFLLILDHSSSMDIRSAADDVRPIDLAREAALRAIETMQPADHLGVLSFNDAFNWDVPIRPLGSGLSLRAAQDAVSGVQATGGTHMHQAMQTGLEGMANLPPEASPSRHILILSDGQSSDGSPAEFRHLAEEAQAQGITISTIAFGEDADTDVLSQIAEVGQGRFYAVTEAEDLPRILIYESQAARSENVQAGQTSLKLGEAGHPILSGLSPRQLPELGGYNALSSRATEGAEDVLVSASFDDPILSTWQYGLGRVVAWTGDIGEEWTGAWPAGVEGVFWSQVVRYALVNPALGPAQVDVRVTETRLVVEAAISGPSGEPLDLAEVTFTYADPAGAARSFGLAQASAGTYRLELPRPPPGAYRAVLAYSGEAGQKIEVPAPFAVNPPEEWQPGSAAGGAANLAAWAGMAGGQLLLPEAALAPESAPAGDRTAGAGDWRWRLLLALAILWPAEIAVRRRFLPFQR
jgi:uncharacterized membrane protein